MSNLNWNDRFAIRNALNLTREQMVNGFKVTDEQLEIAEEMLEAKILRPTTNLDVATYAAKFGVTIPPKDKTPPESIVRTPAATATRATSIPKKRGRKGNKIDTAFGSIPSTPVPVSDFASTHNVSVAVLMQSTRFDPYNDDKGKVYVRKNKKTGVLMIHRADKK